MRNPFIKKKIIPTKTQIQLDIIKESLTRLDALMTESSSRLDACERDIIEDRACHHVDHIDHQATDSVLNYLNGEVERLESTQTTLSNTIYVVVLFAILTSLLLWSFSSGS